MSLFDRININEMELKNRLIRSATWEGMCDESGRPGSELKNIYGELARGGIGLIITGYAYVSPEGKQLPGQMGIYNDSFAGEMRELAASVHSDGGRICMQLVHTGGQASSKASGLTPVAPSSVKLDQYSELPDELSTDDIKTLVECFRNASGRAKSYDFDAVQFHGAHGYLINQFLSPLTNRRTDNYGGSFENRSRFLMEIYNAVRDEVGSDFPVLIKLNGSDFLDGGLEIDDAVAAARLLDDAGIDGIEVSGGTPASGKMGPARGKIDSPENEGYNLHLAKKIKENVKCPVFSVGGFRSLDVMEAAIKSEAADCVSISRPLIWEPDLPLRWEKGEIAEARCISCNGCFIPGLKEGGIYCVEEKKQSS